MLKCTGKWQQIACKTRKIHAAGSCFTEFRQKSGGEVCCKWFYSLNWDLFSVSLGFLFNHKYLNISVFGMLISIGAFYGVVFSESKLASNEKLSELSSCTKNVLLIAQETNSPISYRMIENAQTACVEFAKNQEIVTTQREALAENKTK